MTGTDLESYLCDLLKGRKYLVVVDDVWHRDAWESLKRVFPDRKNDNRVIITIRKEDVAEKVDDKGFVHGLRFLSQKESWNLFCRKLLDVQAMVFRNGKMAFIPRGEERMEDVAEGFLNELIRRRLVQVAEVFWKKVYTLRVYNEYGCLCQLPHETTDLMNLRHLVARYSKPLKCISKLTSPQLLYGISCDQWKDVDPLDLVNLRELRMLGITKTFPLNIIGNLKHLRTLFLDCKLVESLPSLEFLSSCQKLHKLWLNGRIGKMPLSNTFPNSITMLVLWNSKLKEDSMPILGMLPHLRNLDLVRAYEGNEIICSDNNFGQLEFLRLENLKKLERWHLATSAMPLVKGLGIHDCPKLNEIPERMKRRDLIFDGAYQAYMMSYFSLFHNRRGNEK
ncbi:putative disease resistance protein RPP13-like [Capsicum annuum]|uniref:Uncharacterized protein n=1 Tax=Capsicum annuum TaxID=4072 RepID=A0A2G2ZGU5_CAPAN|nr:putative disease resistance protein RPP13-like [Capsicum annuum]KAF3664436.1 putative disease resistance protein RPP13-like [Capsicum annuum]PHT81210.1 hypothetical protein T459_14225 [Capsicum annuum]